MTTTSKTSAGGDFSQTIFAPSAPFGMRFDEPAARLAATFGWLRRHALATLGIILAAGVLGGIAAVYIPSTYTAQSSFYPEARSGADMSSALGSLGALVGAAGGMLGPQQSAFFVDLLKSDAFENTLATSSILTDSLGHKATVEQYLVPKAKTEADRRWTARRKIRAALDVFTEPSGVIVVRFPAHSAVAAAAMANRAVDILDSMNVDVRRRQAVARRRFTSEFLDDVDARLNAAQLSLASFMSANRSVAQSPYLQQRLKQLQGEVERLTTLQQQIASSVENARLTEFNDVPVVVTVDRATAPERPSGPHRLLIALGSCIFAAIGMFWWAYFRTNAAARRA